MSAPSPIDTLLREAESHPIGGWDFSWLGERLSTAELPWDFEQILLRDMHDSPDLLDLGTGGGEFLSGLPHRPARTVATESWPPNVEIASARLRPLGVTVVAVEPAPDNVAQELNEKRGRLPFASGSFALIASRHESFVAAEVARVLEPGGTFVTQQIGGDYREFYDALQLPRPEARVLDLAVARRQVETAGLSVVACDEATKLTIFADVGAFAWYLKAVPWVVDGFSALTHRPHLERLHERIQENGPINLRQPAFWLEAKKHAMALPA